MKNIALVSGIIAVNNRSSTTSRTPISFTHGSAEIVIDDSHSQQGYSLRLKLSFSIAGLTSTQAAELAKMRCADYIEVIDVGGAIYRLGSDSCHLKFSISIHTGSTPGTFRGRKVTVETSQL